MNRTTLLILGSLAWTIPDAAWCDRVTVKGTVLEGTIQLITSEVVVLETVYGKGALSIATGDVEAIETTGDFHVFHGDDVHSVGRIVGVSPQAIQVASADGPAQIAFGEVWSVRSDPGPDAGALERLPVALSYWSGNVDLAFSATQATTHTTALATAVGLRRERGPSRLRFDASYQRATTAEDEDDDRTPEDESDEDVTASELRGLVRQEYDLTKRLYVFGSLEAEHDGVEELAIRSVPKVGLGYVVYESETTRVAVDGGGAYVYERFFGGDENSYPAAALGAESDVELPVLSATWHSRIDYTPSLTDWTRDYLLRGETSLAVPIGKGLSFKASLVDLYNSSPAEDAKGNTLSTLVGLSLGF
jgi:putative salt-induced outer membrane protein YdiY